MSDDANPAEALYDATMAEMAERLRPHDVIERCSDHPDATHELVCAKCVVDSEVGEAAARAPRLEPWTARELQLINSVFTDVATDAAESEDQDRNAEAPMLRELARKAGVAAARSALPPPEIHHEHRRSDGDGLSLRENRSGPVSSVGGSAPDMHAGQRASISVAGSIPADALPLDTLLAWAKRERDDWIRNTERYWQMQRVIIEIERLRAAFPPPPDGGVAETERRHSADYGAQDAQRQREAEALQAGYALALPRVPDLLKQLGALVVHWTTFEDGMHSLDPMPAEKRAKYPDWGWVKWSDVSKLIEAVRASRAGAEALPLPFAHWSKDPLVPYADCQCGSCQTARVSPPEAPQ